MKSSVRRMGESSGVIIPEALLTEFGATAGDAVDVAVEEGRLVIAPVRRAIREGWEQASREIGEAGEGLAWPEFGNDGDDQLTW